MHSCESDQLVSVIIPTFNREYLISNAIESVLNQTYKNIEIIVVDDGSTDNTYELIERKYSNHVRCIKKNNGGVSEARNYGVSCASGKYIAFLDSDDVWCADKLQKQIDFFKKNNNIRIVLTDIELTSQNDNVIGVFNRKHYIPVDGHVLKYVIQKPFLFVSSLLIDKEIYERMDGFDVSLDCAEDIDFYLRIASKYMIGNVDYPLVKCRVTDHVNSSLSSGNNSFENYIKVLNNFISTNGDILKGYGHEVNYALCHAYLKYADHLIYTNQLVKGKKLLLKSIKHRISYRVIRLFLSYLKKRIQVRYH